MIETLYYKEIQPMSNAEVKPLSQSLPANMSGFDSSYNSIKMKYLRSLNIPLPAPQPQPQSKHVVYNRDVVEKENNEKENEKKSLSKRERSGSIPIDIQASRVDSYLDESLSEEEREDFSDSESEEDEVQFDSDDDENLKRRKHKHKKVYTTSRNGKKKCNVSC